MPPIQVANCIISTPYDPFTIMFVRTKPPFNDLSLPGKTMVEGTDTKSLLVRAIKDKTNITIESFNPAEFVVFYSSGGKDYERHVFVADKHVGVPTTGGDRAKYGIEIHSPSHLFLSDWQNKENVKFAPGIKKTILTYYSVLPGFIEKYRNYVPITDVLIEGA